MKLHHEIKAWIRGGSQGIFSGVVAVMVFCHSISYLKLTLKGRNKHFNHFSMEQCINE